MNNYTETFDQFASKLGPTDLALYAGAALVLFVLFKNRLSPVKLILNDLMLKLRSATGTAKTLNIVPEIKPLATPVSIHKEDTFFKLVVSWKQTRDLAVELGCDEAIKVADQMFPYLSPNSCKENTKL